MIVLSKKIKHVNYPKFLNFAGKIDKLYNKTSKVLFINIKNRLKDCNYAKLVCYENNIYGELFLEKSLLEDWSLLKFIYLHEYGHFTTFINNTYFSLKEEEAEFEANKWALEFIKNNNGNKKVYLKMKTFLIELLNDQDVPKTHKKAAKKIINLM